MKSYIRNLAIEVAVAYLIFGMLWISLSDLLVATVISDPHQLTQVQTYKGWLFVFIGTGLVFYLVKRGVDFQENATRRLNEEQERYRLLFENSLDAIVLTGMDGSVQAANQSACRMFGCSEAEICRLGRDGLVDSSDPRLAPAIEERRRTGRFQGELTMLRSDGSPFPVEVSTAVFTNANGRQQSSMIIRDISERRQAERALQASETRFRTLFDIHRDAIWVIKIGADGRPGKFYQVNDAACERLGYTREELLEMSLPDIQPPEFMERLPDLLEALRKDRQVLFETEQITKDGWRVPVEVSTVLFELEGGVASMSVARDITERKRAENELRRHRDHLDDLVKERTAELVVAKEQAEVANRAKGDFLAMMSHEIRTPLNGVLGLAQLVLETDLTARQRDYLVQLKASGEILLSTITDILDFSKIEAGKLELEQVDFSLDDVMRDLAGLLAPRAHARGLDLVFYTSVEVPRQLKGDPLRLRQVLLNLVGNAVKFTHAGEVVVKVSLLQRIERQVKLHFSIRDTGIGMSEVQLEQLFQPFQQADSSTSRKYGGTGLGLTICKQLVGLMGGEIFVDSTPGVGTIFTFTLPMEMQPGEDDDRLLVTPEIAGMRVLVVDDHESARQFLDHLLESFSFNVTSVNSAEQALELLSDASVEPFHLVLMNHELPGVMDGLDAVRIARQNPSLARTRFIVMVSQISAHSESVSDVADGYLTTPISRSTLFDGIMEAFGQETRIHKQPASLALLQAAHEKLNGQRVLLVEDNEINQLVAVEMLQKMGVLVDVADSGEQALQMLDEREYAAVLMDIQMPGMDGYQTTQRIRQNPRFRSDRLPVIAMTAHAMASERQRAIEAELNDYVPKPVEILKLAAVLERWITETSPGQTQTARTFPEQTPAPSTAATAFDVLAALKRLGGDVNLYKRLLAVFQKDHALDVHHIRAAWQDEDMVLAGRLAHSLRSAAATLGAERLAHTAGLLESAVPGRDEALFNDLLAQLERRLAEAMQEAWRLSGEI